MHLGIDFGTCFTSAAVLNGNQFRYVRDSTGGNAQLAFPSAVYLTPDGELLLGTLARNTARKDPTRFRDEFKRQLGSDTPIPLGEKQFLPQELIARLLAGLKEEAEKSFNTTLSDAVLTVPASYDAYRRELMIQAGVTAGFREGGIVLLDEPEAAALYYDWQLQQQGMALVDGAILLVYDLGGGTFDAALMRKEGSRFRSLAPAVGDPYCGGIDFDRVIYDEIMSIATPELKQVLAPENTSTAARRVKLQIADYCRDAKHQLSKVRQVEDVLPGPGSEDFVLTQTTFHQKIAQYVDKTIELCKTLVSSSGNSWDQVNGILLVGGSSRIPYVGTRLSDAFHRPLWHVEDPKLAVCMGAAIRPEQQNTVQRTDQTDSNPQASERDKAMQIINEIIDLANGTLASDRTETQVQLAVNAISEKKRAITSSELFLELSAEIGTLVLSNEDVQLLTQLNARHCASIRSLHIPCCTRLEENLVKEIGKLDGLELLNLSYCPSIPDSAFLTWRGTRQPLLRDVYLRACRRLNEHSILELARCRPNIASLYVDYCLQMSPMLILLGDRVPGLQLLSVVGCTRNEMTTPDAKRLFAAKLPNCKIIGP